MKVFNINLFAWILCFGIYGWAQSAPVQPPITNPNAAGNPEQANDPMPVDADAQKTTGFSDTGMVQGNQQSVIQGPAPAELPPELMAPAETDQNSTSISVTEPESKASMNVAGFIQVQGRAWLTSEQRSPEDRSKYDLTFIPQEIELDVLAQASKSVAIRLDLNLISDWPKATWVALSSDLLTWDLVERLVEQAYGSWQGYGFLVKAGKMNSPFGIEAIDANERLSQDRSYLSRLATPTNLTGVYVSYAILERLDIFAMATNGWDQTVDGIRTISGNRSKAFVLGFPYHFSGKNPFNGTLSAMLGAEKKGVNDLRWLIDYSALKKINDVWGVAWEVMLAEEQGSGFNKKGIRGQKQNSQWWGVNVAVQADGAKGTMNWSKDLQGQLRLEYLHDHDLMLNLPNYPLMTTLFGLTLSGRYVLAKGVSVGLEYTIDLERGDVKHVSMRRDFGWNIFKSLATHEIVAGLVASF